MLYVCWMQNQGAKKQPKKNSFGFFFPLFLLLNSDFYSFLIVLLPFIFCNFQIILFSNWPFWNLYYVMMNFHLLPTGYQWVVDYSLLDVSIKDFSFIWRWWWRTWNDCNLTLIHTSINSVHLQIPCFSFNQITVIINNLYSLFYR